MQTRPKMPLRLGAALKTFFFGSNKPIYGAATDVPPDKPKEKQPCLASHRWRQKQARPHGRRGMRNGKPVRQTLTDRRFMSRSQRARADRGETIYV